MNDMIISERVDKEKHDFELLLNDSYSLISKEAEYNPNYFKNRNYDSFEKDLFNFVNQAAKNTDFENTIHLISGHKFPDIVVKKYFGIEVKTTKSCKWTSTGNSVLESTRIEDVERIYIFFARLSNPIMFRYRLYQECLYDIAVTHSPRYLINMDLDEGETIFDKIGLSYDDLREKDNPIKPIVDYYRSLCKPGEEPWWMDGDISSENVVSPVVVPWRNISKEEQISYKVQAMARFPELFGSSPNKYQPLAAWLAARHGVVDSSLRDRFSAGGKVNLTIHNHYYQNLPRIFLHLQNNIISVIEAVDAMPVDDIMYHYRLPYLPENNTKRHEWAKKIVQYSMNTSKDSSNFVRHLVGQHLQS